jgi:hypothetical protein
VTQAWQEAYDALSKNIRVHPAFARLVREVAVAEQAGAPGDAWRRRNSPTFGAWMRRDMPLRRRGRMDRRAYLFASRIAEALELYPEQPKEAQARVYIEARNYVRARELP